MKKEKNFDENDFNPYKSDALAKMPSWIKILLLKYWVAAAAFFFFLIGNPITQGMTNLSVMLDYTYIFLGLGLGLLNDIIVRNIVRFMKNSKDDTFRYNLINFRGVLSFFANLLYAYILLIPCIFICSAMSEKGIFINFLSVKGGMDPLTFAFIFCVLDVIIIFIKDLIIYIYKNVKYNKRQKEYKVIELKLLNEMKEEK